nr:uncharacterized protein LOC114827452 [Malus domestica]
MRFEGSLVFESFNILVFAFELRRPHKLYQCFSEIWRKRETEKQIDKAFLPLARKRSSCYFAYVRERNTKAKLCHVAHFVLLKVLNILSPTKINEIKGVGEILEGLPSYSQRHFSRMDKHETDTYLNQRQIQGYCMTSL